MELELKHLAPYLPYNLECKVCGDYNNDCESDGLKTFKIVGIVDDEIITQKEGYISNIENEIEDIFPILRPLSDLTEKYVSSQLIENYNSCSNRDIKKCLDYDSLTYLLSLHFDIFGLIENNLAIDINTLKQ